MKGDIMTREEKNKSQQDYLDNILNRENRKKIVLTTIKILSIIIILFLCFYFYTRYISTGGVIVKEKRIINEKITDNFNGLKIVHFSDLLYGTTIDDNNLKRIVKLINERKPDIVLYTGNLVDSEYSLSSKDQEKIIKFLSEIDSTYGKYAVFGNQDNESYRTIMNQSNFKVLSNSYDLIYKATRDGDKSENFHSKCDSVENTLVIIKTTLGKIFGGFTTKLWNHKANHTNDPLAFAFSNNNQKIYNILDNKKGECAIYPHNSYGPCFGNGTDFGLHSGCIGRKDNWCGSQKTFNYNGEHLNGAYNFQVLDYEVYHVIFE